VGFGHFTKQLAKEAIGSQVKDMMDSFRPADAAGAAAPVSPDNVAVAIIGQVQAMQNALKDDMELLAVCTIGPESMRVFEIYAATPKVLVLTGIDADRTVTRVISPAEALQLVCKPQSVQGGGKATRIKFIVPKPRPE
jgi:hypothetical protein